MTDGDVVGVAMDLGLTEWRCCTCWEPIRVTDIVVIQEACERFPRGVDLPIHLRCVGATSERVIRTSELEWWERSRRRAIGRMHRSAMPMAIWVDQIPHKPTIQTRLI